MIAFNPNLFTMGKAVVYKCNQKGVDTNLVISAKGDILNCTYPAAISILSYADKSKTFLNPLPISYIMYDGKIVACRAFNSDDADTQLQDNLADYIASVPQGSCVDNLAAYWKDANSPDVNITADGVWQETTLRVMPFKNIISTGHHNESVKRFGYSITLNGRPLFATTPPMNTDSVFAKAEGHSFPLDKMNDMYYINLGFSQYMFKQLGKVYGEEKMLSFLNLSKACRQLGTMSLHNVPDTTLKIAPMPRTFLEVMTYLVFGLHKYGSSVDAIAQFKMAVGAIALSGRVSKDRLNMESGLLPGVTISQIFKKTV